MLHAFQLVDPLHRHVRHRRYGLCDPLHNFIFEPIGWVIAEHLSGLLHIPPLYAPQHLPDVSPPLQPLQHLFHFLLRLVDDVDYGHYLIGLFEVALEAFYEVADAMVFIFL